MNFNSNVYLISCLFKKTKAGKDYITGDLKSKDGVYKYNIWDNLEQFSILKQGHYYFVKGLLEEYNQNMQINIKSAVEVIDSDINQADFKNVSIFDIDKLLVDFHEIINSFTDDFIIFLAKEMLTSKFLISFSNTPAAKDVHGAWVGGLIEHAVTVARLGDFVVEYYNRLYFENKINRDIVIFGSLFHDLGKIWEYDYSSPSIEVTKVGELLGHLYLSAKKISDISKNYIGENIDDKLMRVLHVILAHHGKLEWGAPVTPKTPEAIIVHYMDNVDAKLMNFWENTRNCNTEFTKKNYVHENARLYNVFFNRDLE